MRRRLTIFLSSVLILILGFLANSYAQKPKQIKATGKTIQAKETAKNVPTQLAAAKKETSPVANQGSRKTPDKTASAPRTNLRGVSVSAPSTGKAVGFAKTPTVRELFAKQTYASTYTGEKPSNRIKPSVREIPNQEMLRKKQEMGLIRTEDGAAQRVTPEPKMPLPDISFDASTQKDNVLLFGGTVNPPDTVGDVGPSHYVQAVNIVMNIYDKSGNLIVGPFAMSNLFASLGGVCASTDSGDPIILYDHLADRWLVTQFAVVGPPFHQCIAVSQNGDPTGSYYVYDFIMPNTKFNDYPHFGVWPDGYYMMDHQFNAGITAFQGSGAFAFDREKMLAGEEDAGFVYFDLQFLDPTIGGHLPADLDGPPPPAGTPNYFVMFRADEFGDPADGLEIYEFDADFENPGLSTFTSIGTVPVAAFIPDSPAGRDDIPQPPPSNPATMGLDAIADRLMNRLQYRNFGTHESLVMNHTVDADPGAGFQAAVRYYELRRDLPGGSFDVNEQATFAPDTHDRWMGSVAMDGSGNIALGYSVSSLTVMPSIRVAGRLADDPPNGLWQGEVDMVTGTGVQTTTNSRWGDYSAMSIDPVDDCTFWYTQEYYAVTGELCPTLASTACWHTRILAFEFPGCHAVAQGTLEGFVYDANSNPVEAARVILEDANGDFWEAATDASGHYSRLLAPGVYTAFARATNYEDSASSEVTVTEGGTTSQDFNLGEGHPVLALDGTTFDDTNGDNNGRIDVNECINLTVSLANIGTADATGVSATLVSNTPGVTVGQATQPYADIAVGDDISNGIPFTVSIGSSLTCTDHIELTLTAETEDGTFNIPVTLEIGSGSVNNIPLADAGTVVIPITMAGVVGNITDVDFSMHIQHTWDGDLDIFLTAPDGVTTINLTSDNGGAGDNFGTSCGARTVFNDAAGGSITAGVAPFAGSFQPEQPLSTFNGLNANGTWTLTITDDTGQDSGTLICATVIVNNQPNCSDAGGVCSDAAPNLVVGDPIVSGGNGDNDVDENDCIDVEFPISNIGTADATNVRATIATTNPNITILQDTSTYGTIPVGGSASNDVPFQIATTSCPDNTEFTVTIEADEGPKETTAGLLSTGTFTANPQLNIPDNNGDVEAPVVVSGMAGTVTDVNVTMRVSHTYGSDLEIYLVAPDGTFALLTGFPNGGDGDGYGIDCPPDDNDTTFDDDAVTPIGAGSAPFSGTFLPEDPMSTFNGVDPNGTWNLVSFDTWPGDVGIIHCFELDLTTTNCDDALGVCSQAPVLSINDRTIAEGNSGTTNFVFTAHLSFPTFAPVTADAFTNDGTALTADNDYTAVGPFPVSIAAGDQDDYITVPVTGDTTYELDEDFTVDLIPNGGIAIPGKMVGTGNILNDDPCPVITVAPPTLPDQNVNTAYNQIVSASGAIGPYTFAVTDGALPTGLSLDGITGAITGNLDEGGTFTFDITATDAGGCTGTTTYTINVICPVITLSPLTLPNGQQNTLYTATTITPSGGVGPYTFAVTDGTLPDGLQLDENTGEVSGTPTGIGISVFDITATDSFNCEGTQTYSVTIAAECLYCDEFDDFSMNWTVIRPTWSENGTALIGSPARTAIAIAPNILFAGCQVCNVEAAMESAGGFGNKLWLLAWYVNKLNTMELLVKEEGDKIILRQRVGGVIVKKQKALVTLLPGVSYAMRIEFDGTDFELFVDDVSVMIFTPAAAVPSGTIGFQVKNTTGTFDYVAVTD